MTISEAISHVDLMKPNQYDAATKKAWLSKLDGQIFKELFMTHENSPAESFEGYESAEDTTELLVPYPYDEDVYNYFLQSQIDKENGEIGKYNQSVTMYNNAYETYAAYYNRTHMPIPKGKRFVF